ncbi:DUF6350 family protein [Leekyejoonella antrihumi]|uniref:Uncharacterized protein n=1 Tax=Leekyejoonella antrihumi TaxID=1660198 RepID=A0A563E097_9MICO|nr:DUF6350 family protein [Leekyejoonella antrihumi]TWP35936.1 hypothetical protein FGL98_11940 [Leekyejoonella antrihumi]
MSLLERTRNTVVGPDAEPPDWRPLGVSAGYGVIGALAMALVLLLLSLVAWVVDPHSSVGWMDNLAFAAAAWGMVHRGSLAVQGDGITHVVLAPLLLTLLAAYLARLSAGALTAYLGGLEERPRRWWEPAVAFVLGYVVAGVALAVLASSGPMHPHALTVIPGAVLIGGAGVLWATWRSERVDDDDDTDDDRPLTDSVATLSERLPSTLTRALRPAGEGILGFLALGTLLVLLLVLFHLGRIETVGSELGAGLVGTVVLSLAQLAMLPNLALYAGSWLTGAGVHLGAVSISSGAVHAGTLPMLPVLGAVPSVGALPSWMGAAPLLPVLLGAGIGWRAGARHTMLAPMKAKVSTAASAAGLATLGLVVLIWLSTASVSPGALQHFGPSLMVVPLLAVELVLGATVTAAGAHWLRTRR